MNALRNRVSVSAQAIASSAMADVDNATLPELVRVPDGHPRKAWKVGIGEVHHACRDQADQPDRDFRTVVAPAATLHDAERPVVGTDYAGPTWASKDGSEVTGKQVATAPTAPGHLPLQRFKANPTGPGRMTAVRTTQHLNTAGAALPARSCEIASLGREVEIPDPADRVCFMPR